MEGIERVCEFLNKVHTYYLATVEGDQPRVRPFGTAMLYEGKAQGVSSRTFLEAIAEKMRK